MKRIIAITLCLCFVFGLSACRKKSANSSDDSGSVIYEYQYVNGTADGKNGSGNGKNGSNSNGNNGSGKNESGKNSNGKVTVENNCYSSGLKIAKDKITLKVLARDYTGGITDYNNCALTKYIESEMNVKLEYTTCEESEVTTKMTLAYASGTNPYDLYMGMAPASSFHDDYIKQGKLKKLDSLIDKYGPNIQRCFSENPQAQYLCTAEDGGIYMLPMVDDQDNYSDLLFINKKWLSSVGKGLPTTTVEFKSVLEAFKKRFPGKTPFVTTSDAGADIGPAAVGPFGISTYHNWVYIDQSSDEIKFAGTADEYRNALRYYNSLYSAGLMNFASNEDDIRKMTDADSVGCILCDSYAKALSAEVSNSSWTLVPVLNSDSGGTWANVKCENTWPEWFVITDSCQYPECAVRLCDWFYSEEGTISTQYGPEGEYWSYDREGNIKLNNSKVPDQQAGQEYLYTLTPSYCLPRLMDQKYHSLELITSDESENTQRAKTIKQLINTLIKPKAKQKYYYPHLSYTAGENKQIADIENFAQYTYQMRNAFITGTKSVDSDWDSYVATINSTYQMDTVLKVQNTAYKRYKAWMATK